MTRLLDRIIDGSAEHRSVVLLAALALALAGVWCLLHSPADAMPDLGETQVIVATHWERSPQMIEDQVTYPLVTTLLGVPHATGVRGMSDYGLSLVTITFADGTDAAWARTRVNEYLTAARARIPAEAQVELGPDATSLGWIFQYALVDSTHTHTLGELRTLQESRLANLLRGVPGVAEVATAGGFRPQFQVNVDPARLEQYGLSIRDVIDAVRAGNDESSGRALEFGGTEYTVRGHGYARTLDDFRDMVIRRSTPGIPLRVRDLGEVSVAPDMRRSAVDLDGKGEVVSGIVMMHNGENALDVIRRVKYRLRSANELLPTGVRVVPVYDRSDLITRTLSNTAWSIAGVAAVLLVIVLLFLWHPRSALVPLVTMPLATLMALIPLHWMGVGINLMSLAGFTLAFGEFVDASLIAVEQAHKRLEMWDAEGRPGPARDCVLAGIRQVAAPAFFSLLVIAASVLPILALDGQQGRMFAPLGLAKTFAMLAAAVIAITVDPALRLLLVPREKSALRPLIRREQDHPLTGRLMRFYQPVVAWALQHKAAVLLVALTLLATTVPVFRSLGSELLPDSDEGTLLYMPTTVPGISITQAQQLVAETDRILMQFPEVDHVLGKAGRADTPTDPAPLSMLETVITLRPHNQWRRVPTWYSNWAPAGLRRVLRHITPDTLSKDDLVAQMDAALAVPGLVNAWTAPIRGRLDMQSTGFRSALGLKLQGDNLADLEQAGRRIETALRGVPGTRNVFAERFDSGRFIDVDWNRTELARYGISMEDAQSVVSSAIGGDNISEVVSGRNRFAVNVRYMRDFRSSLDQIGRALVTAHSGGHTQQIPVSELAQIHITTGAASIRDEDGLLTENVYIDVAGRDLGGYVAAADAQLRRNAALPPGVVATWSGQYQAMQRSTQRLRVAIPFTLAVIALLIFTNTGSWTKTGIVLLGIPFSAIGAAWMLFLLHYNLSVAVWVGLIGLMSVDAETGVFMLLYLDLAFEEARSAGRLHTRGDLREAIFAGSARRVRPKCMTFATTCLGLLPMLWSTGAGAEMMKHIAAPMIGGIATSFLLELVVYPVLYELWRGRALVQAHSEAETPLLNDQPALAPAGGD